MSAYEQLGIVDKVKVNAQIIGALSSIDSQGWSMLKSAMALNPESFQGVLDQIRDSLAGKVDQLPPVKLNGEDDTLDLAAQRSMLRLMRDDVLPKSEDDAGFVASNAIALAERFELPDPEQQVFTVQDLLQGLNNGAFPKLGEAKDCANNDIAACRSASGGQIFR